MRAKIWFLAELYTLRNLDLIEVVGYMFYFLCVLFQGINSPVFYSKKFSNTQAYFLNWLQYSLKKNYTFSE